MMAEGNENRRLRGEVVKWLLEKTEIKGLPASAVEHETRRILQDIVRENVRRGISKEELESHKDDIYNSAAKSSSDRVKLDCILGRIAVDEKIEVADQELTQEIERLAYRYSMPVAKMRNELEQHNALDGLRDDLRSAKTIEAVLQQAKIED